MTFRKGIRRRLVHAAGHQDRLKAWKGHEDYVMITVEMALRWGVHVPRSMRHLVQEVKRRAAIFGETL